MEIELSLWEGLSTHFDTIDKHGHAQREQRVLGKLLQVISGLGHLCTKSGLDEYLVDSYTMVQGKITYNLIDCSSPVGKILIMSLMHMNHHDVITTSGKLRIFLELGTFQ